MIDALEEKQNELARLARERIVQIDAEIAFLKEERVRVEKIILGCQGKIEGTQTVRTKRRVDEIEKLLREVAPKRLTVHEIRQHIGWVISPSALSHTVKRLYENNSRVKARIRKGFKRRKEFWWDLEIQGPRVDSDHS